MRDEQQLKAQSLETTALSLIWPRTGVRPQT